MPTFSDPTYLPRWLGLPHRRRGTRRQFGPVAAPRQHAARYLLALAMIGVITLACLNMALGMAPGLPVVSDVSARIDFLSQHTLRWQLGWCNWMLAAIGLLTFCLLIADYVPRGISRKLGVALIAIGIAPDISAEVLYAFVLPQITAQEHFLLLDRIAMLLTGLVGNGAYCLGGLLLNLALLRNPSLSRRMIIFGLPSWLIGLLISVSVAINAMTAAGIFTGIAMTWNVIWMFWFTQAVLRDPSGATRYA